MLGMVELQKGDFKRAYGNFAKVVELNPQHISTHIQMGKLLLANRMPDKAKEKAETVLKLEPGNEDALLLKASVLMLEKDSSGALNLLTGLLRRGVKQPDLFILASSAQLLLNKTKEAEKTLLSGIEVNSGVIVLYMKLAEIYMREKQFASAVATVQKVIGLAPGNINYQLALAAIYWESGKADKSVDLLRELVAADPGNEGRRLQIAGFYISRGFNRDAERELIAGIRANGKSFKLRFALGDLYLKMNMTENALATIRECLSLSKDQSHPDIMQAKNILARIYLSRQELGEAARYADEVIKESAKNVDAHFTRGNIFLIKGDGSKAVAEFRIVVNEKQQFIPGYIRLADAHMRNKEYKLAENTLQTALKKDPQSRDLIRALARLSAEQQN
jgi:tetratricopeptide (TPR) repeat protein